MNDLNELLRQNLINVLHEEWIHQNLKKLNEVYSACTAPQKGIVSEVLHEIIFSWGNSSQ